MENVAEAGEMFGRDCYFEERGVITDQAMKELNELVECGETLDEIINAISISSDGSVWGGFADDLLDFAKGLTCATSAVKELSLSADFAAESAKTFIAVWRDGKWVPTENRSSRRKMGVGGKRW